MTTYIKANLAAIAASFLDFALVFVLVQWVRVNVSAATAAGMVCGGTLAFVLGRGWAFGAASGAAGGQVFRYALVWIGNIVFSTILVGWVASWHGVHFMVARVSVSIVMGLTYSYFLQRLFVFPKTSIAAQNHALNDAHPSPPARDPRRESAPGEPRRAHDPRPASGPGDPQSARDPRPARDPRRESAPGDPLGSRY